MATFSYKLSPLYVQLETRRQSHIDLTVGANATVQSFSEHDTINEESSGVQYPPDLDRHFNAYDQALRRWIV